MIYIKEKLVSEQKQYFHIPILFDSIFKADWSDFFVIRVSNNFPYKPLILKSYTSRIGLLSKLEILKVNENNFYLGKRKNKPKSIMGIF